MARADCVKALVPTTHAQDVITVSDIVLASTVSQDQYQRAQQSASAHGVIYGIPIGAGWDDFQENINAFRSTLNINDYEEYRSHYEDSSLSQESLQAYRACLVAGGGLALNVEHLGHKSYVLRLTYNPFPGAQIQKGEVAGQTNLKPETVVNVAKQVSEQSFGAVDLQFVVQPVDPEEEATLEIKVGAAAEVVTLPPLITPVLKRVVITTKTIALEAGGGNPDWDIKEDCITPTRGKFIPSTAHVVQEYNPHNEPTPGTIITKTPEQICARYRIHNDSGAFASTYAGHISVVEVYMEKPQV